MASESTEEKSVTISLPAELDDWLESRAETLDVDREILLVELLDSHRAIEEDGVDSWEEIADHESIRETVAEEVEARLTDEMKEVVEWVVAETFESRFAEATDDLSAEFEDRIEAVEETQTEKIDDVRDRVVQVKRETDQKAPADHDHEAFDRIDSVESRLDDIEERVGTIDQKIDERDDDAEAMEERLESVEDRLKTVAWIVRDLRDAHETGGGIEAVERIKRAAAKADIERARCENCNQGVSLGLLTEPECPHCQATVTNVEPADGFFSKPTLLVASQLESGEDE
jgi:chromosome segregation ATPase